MKQLNVNDKGQLVGVTKLGPAEMTRLNVHRARARRNQIAAMLANGQVDEIQREMLEEEEAELENMLAITYASQAGNPALR